MIFAQPFFNNFLQFSLLYSHYIFTNHEREKQSCHENRKKEMYKYHYFDHIFQYKLHNVTYSHKKLASQFRPQNIRRVISTKKMTNTDKKITH